MVKDCLVVDYSYREVGRHKMVHILTGVVVRKRHNDYNDERTSVSAARSGKMTYTVPRDETTQSLGNHKYH